MTVPTSDATPQCLQDISGSPLRTPTASRPVCIAKPNVASFFSLNARLIHAYYAHHNRFHAYYVRHNRFHAYYVHHNRFQQEAITAGVVLEVRKRKQRTKLIYFICLNDRLSQSLFYSFVDVFSLWLIQWNVRCLTNTSLSIYKSFSKSGRQWDSQ